MDLVENLMVIFMCSYDDKYPFFMELSRKIVYSLEIWRLSTFRSPSNSSELCTRSMAALFDGCTIFLRTDENSRQASI